MCKQCPGSQYECVCMCVRVRACVRACVCVCEPHFLNVLWTCSFSIVKVSIHDIARNILCPETLKGKLSSADGLPRYKVQGT